jgi:alanine dehydrogenase
VIVDAPLAAGMLAKAGHQVLVETKVGEGSGFAVLTL